MQRRIITALLASLPGLLPLASHAELAAWLSFGGQIPGGSTHPAHPGWIDIEGFEFGLSRDISTGGQERVPGLPFVSQLSLVKFVDVATAPLFSAASARNTPYPRVTLDLNINGEQPITRIELEGVLVSSQSFEGSSGGSARPTEIISLNFTKITFTYIAPTNGSTFTSYDLATRQSSTGTSADVDTDGLPDAWESLYGLLVGTNDANSDRDGDGLSNLHEFQLGTLPNSGTSFFKAQLSPNPSNSNQFQIQWNSVGGKTYIIEWSPNLSTPFTPVRTVTATAGSTTENLAKAGNLGFYRVRPQ
jgi:type VI protein secretion system component Hcp